MNMTSNGKIGRLPKHIREEANRRLENGEHGLALAAWLNSLPEVQAVMAAQFDGRPVAAHNVSQWRRHGYREWLRWREAQAMMAEAAKPGAVPVAGTEPLMDQITKWASVYYLMMVRELNREKGDGAAGSWAKLKMLRALCRDAVALQRGECRSGMLKLGRERLEFKLKKGDRRDAYPAI
jgi:hypothetical protein